MVDALLDGETHAAGKGVGAPASTAGAGARPASGGTVSDEGSGIHARPASPKGMTSPGVGSMLGSSAVGSTGSEVGPWSTTMPALRMASG